jgi:hypothetical protein
MGIKRLLFKKSMLGGGLIKGHIFDALEKKKETGKTFMECLRQSVSETVTEDLPGSSHIYQWGKKDGRKNGTIEQAARDEQKFKQLHEQHEQDKRNWEKIDEEKDVLIDDLSKNFDTNNGSHANPEV